MTRVYCYRRPEAVLFWTVSGVGYLVSHNTASFEVTFSLPQKGGTRPFLLRFILFKAIRAIAPNRQYSRGQTLASSCCFQQPHGYSTAFSFDA